MTCINRNVRQLLMVCRTNRRIVTRSELLSTSFLQAKLNSIVHASTGTDPVYNNTQAKRPGGMNGSVQLSETRCLMGVDYVVTRLHLELGTGSSLVVNGLLYL